jgi:hypothetical protein
MLFSTTETSAIVASAGIPLTEIELVAPADVLSGTVNEPVDKKGEVVIFVPVTAGALSNNEPPVPQIAPEGGVIVKAGGVALTVTVEVTRQPVKV